MARPPKTRCVTVLCSPILKMLSPRIVSKTEDFKTQTDPAVAVKHRESKKKQQNNKKTKIGKVQLQKVQNKTNWVSFRLYAFVRHKNKNNKTTQGFSHNRKLTCFVLFCTFWGCTLPIFFLFYGASQLFTKLHCDILLHCCCSVSEKLPRYRDF